MKTIPDIFVLDDFYPNPLNVRKLALSLPLSEEKDYYKGKRTKPHRYAALKDTFEELLGAKITDWDDQPYNGSFHFTDPTDHVVIHSDSQNYAGAIYLTPDAPPEAGTTFYRSKATGLRLPPGDAATEEKMYANKLLDLTAWEPVDRIGNVFNRLVLWNGKLVHSGSIYFGFNRESCRVVHLFFFNVAV